MAFEKLDEDLANLCDKEADKMNTENLNVSVAQINSKDELNWVENEIVIVDSFNNKVTKYPDFVSNTNDSVSGDCLKVADIKISGVSKCKTAIITDENETKLWEYFTQHNSSQLRCNLCSGLFLYQSNASHLLRHVEVVHNMSVLAIDKPIEVAVGSVDLKAPSNTTVNLGRTVGRAQECSAKNDSFTSVFPCDNQPNVITSTKLNDKVREYYTRLESGKMRCNLCCRVLTYDSDKSIIFRHLHSYHCDTYQFIIKSTNIEDCEFAKLENVSDIVVANVLTENKTRRKNKTICIGEYFAELGNNRVKCKFCRAVLKYSEGVVKNLVRHLKMKHEDMLFKKDLITTPKIKMSKSALVLEIIQVNDKCLITNAQLEIENNNKSIVEFTNTDSLDLIGNDQTQSLTELESIQKIRPIESIEKKIKSRKKIWGKTLCKTTFWDYCTKLHSNNTLRCNICFNEFKCGDSTKHMFNHLLIEHGISLLKLSESSNSFEFETSVSETGEHSIESLNFEYELKKEITVNDITNINLSSILHSKKDNHLKMTERKPKRKVISMYSRLWNHYTKLYRGKAMCKICKKAVSYKLGQISHLAKHLQVQHRFGISKSNKRIMKNKIGNKKCYTKTRTVWTFFTKLNDSKVECNLCDKIIVQYYSSRSKCNLIKHLHCEHKNLLDLYRDRKNKVVMNEVTAPNIINISNENIDECRPEITMKTLFTFFSNDTSLQKWIKFENGQIICKLCTGMFICDDLLNFGRTIKRHIESCHAFAFISMESAFMNNILSDDHQSETDERLEIVSDSS